MFLSAAMMLEWLGVRHDDARLSEAAQLLENAVRAVFADGRVRPIELGGNDGTQSITAAVLDRLAGRAHTRSPPNH
jgi:3-isopropylmalate dehydrogenase